MSQIRRQSIISSLVVYIGFGLGFINTYLFTRQGGFTKEEYGLTGIFIAVATLMYSFANLGAPAYIYKFYPYYNDNLNKKQNDIFSWAILFTLIGFCFVTIGGVYFKDLIIRKFGENSPDFVKYYYWIFPFGFGLTLFSLFEVYAWQLKRSILTNFLKEVQFRIFTTILIVLTFIGVLAKFDMFIKLYSFEYLALAIILFIYLVLKNEIHFTFNASIVTKKFLQKILAFISFVYGGTLVFVIANIFDQVLIASVLKDGLSQLAIFTFALYVASIMQAPQRSIISSSIAALSQAWKDKDLKKIEKIYKQSSINQLIFSIGVFALIWLNFTDAIAVFHMQVDYKAAKWIFFFIGLMRIVDMGTGVNAQIIATSTSWKFDFFTGILLLSITIPLNYILTKYYFGVIGPAIANLFSFTVYNAIRFWFLNKKFKLQPFNAKTLYTIVLGIVCYYCCYFLLKDYHSFLAMLIKSIFFIAMYVAGTFLLKLSDDVLPVWQTIQKKLGIIKA
ncbi:MAG TPA: polysaccharide biosynthesis C-terminal domain-containing protein [Ferruginibacter sp.]|nr:polysaccharide biosynthesis C-terminal domain-containing protein [Ferruginibacter sp.]